jgi:hypothetical protein
MATAKVTVNRAGIQSLFEPGGPVGREATSIGTQTVADIRATGPRRTGRLVGSFGNRGAMANLGYTVTVSSRVEYAGYVTGGTGPRIYPKNGQWLKVPRAEGMALGGPGSYTFRHSVRGQQANPFHIRSGERVLRAHGFAISLS